MLYIEAVSKIVTDPNGFNQVAYNSTEATVMYMDRNDTLHTCCTNAGCSENTSIRLDMFQEDGWEILSFPDDFIDTDSIPVIHRVLISLQTLLEQQHYVLTKGKKICKQN